MTQHNIFLRKFGKYAVLITVTDWEDFKDFEKFSTHDEPDLLISGTTSANIYTNMNPCITINKWEAKDITEETKGDGLAGIITGDSNAGPIWAFRKIEGLTALQEMITPKV